MTKLRGIDLFCGAGGTTTGAELSGQVTVALAINHWDTAISTHRLNHPHVRHLCAPIDLVDPRDFHGQGLDLLMASPECIFHSNARGGKPVDDQRRATAWCVPRWAEVLRPKWLVIENVREFCFPADTAVVSKRGIVPIGELQVGDELWTHNARWKPVTAIARRTAATVSVKGYGNSIIETTPNHQFYARQYAPKITQSGKYGRHEARLLEPEWIRADALAAKDESTAYTDKYSGYAWATPCELPRYWMRMPTTLGVDVAAPAFFYMLGRWLGDGWIRKRKNKQHLVRICANLPEADDLQRKLADTGLTWHRGNHSESVDVFDLSAGEPRNLIRWLTANFGQFAGGKTLPAWIYSASQDQRWALIEGYCDADGHEQREGEVSSTSVSRCLAVGIKLLLQSLGTAASISKVDAREMRHVTARESTMQCRAAYSVSWRRETEFEKCHRTDLHIWGRIREVAPCRESVEVVDVTVADDHSFIADGQVVHNCDWGALGSDNKPLKSKKGEIFEAWISTLRALNYHVEWRILNAADFGGATKRQRLFIVGRRGPSRQPIPWPAITHTKANWASAASIIDWSLPCPSIFGRKRPLAEKTLRRIEIGLRKFCGPGAEPFIVKMRGTNHSSDLQQPLPTVTGGGNHEALAMPFQFKAIGRNPGQSKSILEPLPTIVATRENHAVVAPFLVPNFGERAGQEPRTHGVNEPLPVVTGHGAGQLVMPFVSTFHNGADGERRNSSMREPLPTADTQNRHAVVAPYLMDVNHGGDDGRGQSVQSPLGALTTKNGKSLVFPFLTQYFGTGHSDSVNEPLSTVTTKHRHGLAVVHLLETMKELGIVDIGFRMLEPHEMAAAQGFPPGYQIFGTKADQVKQIGNSVHTAVARALCQAIGEAA